MSHAQIQNDIPVEIASGTVYSGDLSVNYLTMTADQRVAFGLLDIVDDPIPNGKIAIGSSLALHDGGVVRRWELINTPLPPVPQSISDRQFAQVLANIGLISEDDALAWVKVGTVPAPLQMLVDSISDDDVKFAANMLLGGATEFNRNHPMVAQLGAGLQMDAEQIDDIWRMGINL